MTNPNRPVSSAATGPGTTPSTQTARIAPRGRRKRLCIGMGGTRPFMLFSRPAVVAFYERFDGAAVHRLNISEFARFLYISLISSQDSARVISRSGNAKDRSTQ